MRYFTSFMLDVHPEVCYAVITEQGKTDTKNVRQERERIRKAQRDKLKAPRPLLNKKIGVDTMSTADIYSQYIKKTVSTRFQVA